MNKKLLIMSLLGLFTVLLLSAFAQAAVNVGGVTDGKLVLTVDYSDLDEDDDGESTMDLSQVSLTFTNDNNTSTEDVVLTLENVPSDYTLVLSETSFTLEKSGEANDSKTVTLDVAVPVSADSGVHSLGTLDVNGVDYTLETSVKSMLELKEIDVYVNSDEEDELNDNGDEINNVRPGSEIELKFEIRNLFDKDYEDGEMEDVELTVTMDDDDFGDEVDEEEDFDLDADEKLDDGEVVIEFDVPMDAEEGDYDLEIRLEGKDENGAKHVVEWTVVLEVDRERDDVQLETAKLMSETLSCGETTYLKIKVTNFGSNDQDDAALSIYNKELGIQENFFNLDLESDPDDDDNSYSKSILVNPGKDMEPGIYYIDIRAYINDDEQVDDQLVKLTVDACGVTTDTTDDSSDDSSDTTSDDTSDVVVVTMPTDSVDLSSPTTAGTTLVTSETSFSDVKGAVVLMSVIVGLLVILIVLSAAILVKK